MTLHTKTFFIVVAVLIEMMVLVYVISQLVILKSFDNLERDRVELNLDTVRGAVDADLANLSGTVSDYAIWDDSYKFVLDGNNTFITSSLGDDTFKTNRLNFIVYLNTKGEIIYSNAFDLRQGKKAPFPQSLYSQLSLSSPFLRQTRVDSSISGIIVIPQGALLIAARPIVTSRRQGPIHGVLVMARFLDDTEVQYVSQTTNVSLRSSPINQQMPPDFQTVLPSLSKSHPYSTKAISETKMAGYTAIFDVYGKPAVLLQTELSRDIYQQGKRTVTYFMFILIAISSAFIFIMLLILDKLVLSRLAVVTSSVDRIGITGDFTARIELSGKDEMAGLAKTINGMLDRLVELEQKSEHESKELARRVMEIQMKNNALEQTRIRITHLVDTLHKEKVQIEQAKARDDAFLQSIGDGVVVVDKEGVVQFVNQSLVDMLGCQTHDLLGKKWAQEFPNVKNEQEEEIALDSTPAYAALRLGKRVDGKNWLKRTDEKLIPVAAVASPVMLSGNIMGAIIVLRDITHEIELDRMKDEFVSIASHELRTPMTAIKGLISMIMQGDYGQVTQELRTPLQFVSTATDRLIHLVNDMLSVSRIESGRLKYMLTTMQIPPAIEKIVSLFESIATEKNTAFVVNNLDGSVLQADPEKVDQILSNLLGNALKFTSKGSVTVTTKRDADFLQILVTDTGIGIPAKDQNRLFGKFVQLVPQAEGGTALGAGLGLYICRKLARKMGGDVWLVSSAVGKGSTFAFSLPLADTKTAEKVSKMIEKEAALHPDQK